MTDDEQQPHTPDSGPEDEKPSGIRRTNGADVRKPTSSVRSGLAERKNPVGVALRTFAENTVAFVFKDIPTLVMAILAVAIAIVFFVLLGSTTPDSTGRQVPLTAVFAAATAKDISSATLLDHDNRVEFTTHENQQLWSAYPDSDVQTQPLIRALNAAGATVTVDQQSHKGLRIVVVQFLLPILLLVALFGIITRMSADGGAGGIAAFSNFTGKGRKKGKGTAGRITFDDIAGVPEALAELREIRDYLNDPSKYINLGAAAPKGVLLVGPPGTGKTLLAKAVAGEADASFFSLSGSDFVESLVGVGAARVRDLFRKARAAAPAIIFIDEFDAAGRKRGAGIGQGNDEREQTLNQLLVEMDGFSGDGGLVVMGATNRPDILDPALLRPGRFDRQVTVDVPDVHGRAEILKLHGTKRPMGADADLDEIAKLTPGFSGAELANVVNEAALLTVREGREAIDQKTLEEAIDRVVAGPAKKHVLTEHERWLISIHEAAHVVVTTATGQVTAARKVSIVARGRSLGTAAHMLTDKDQLIMQQPDLERQLIAIVAGLAGEMREFGFYSTGVNDDLHEATAIARSMVTSFGMSDRLGPVTIGEKPGEVFLGASLQDLGSTGPSTLDLIDSECEQIVGDAVARADEVLRRNWLAVHETAHALLEHETLSGVALDAVLSTVQDVPVETLQDVRWARNGNGNGLGRRRSERDLDA